MHQVQRDYSSVVRIYYGINMMLQWHHGAYFVQLILFLKMASTGCHIVKLC
jgi:hypothetical protein